MNLKQIVYAIGFLSCHITALIAALIGNPEAVGVAFIGALFTGAALAFAD